MFSVSKSLILFLEKRLLCLLQLLLIDAADVGAEQTGS